MSKGKHISNKSRGTPATVIIFLLIAVIFILLIALGMLFFSRTSSPAPSPAAAPTPTAVVKNKNTISVPGYEALNLTADAKEQSLALSNPAQNTCLFEISLLLEDGTLLWKSEYIEPGKVSENIVLNRELSAGAYNALLHYNCFTADKAHKQLNSAETKLTLLVN